MTTRTVTPEETQTTRDRLVDAAVQITTHEGWSHVTMGRLAGEVGVSRQTVYNELGTKPGLAEAMVSRELARFLEVVETAFGVEPDDIVAAIGEATRRVLELAQDNLLLHAVVSATHGADTELLPLLTTHSESLLDVAKAVVVEHVVPYRLPLSADELDAVIDMVVRLVLSHVMQPTSTPEATADSLRWIARRVLDPGQA